MSRYRKVHTRMHADEKYRRLSRPPPCGQALWWNLIAGEPTGPMPGLIRVGEAALAEMLGWSLKGLRAAFVELEAQNMAVADWSARLIWLPKAAIHNPPASPSAALSWADLWAELPECELKTQARDGILRILDSGPPQSADAFRVTVGLLVRAEYDRRYPNQGGRPRKSQGGSRKQNQGGNQGGFDTETPRFVDSNLQEQEQEQEQKQEQEQVGVARVPAREPTPAPRTFEPEAEPAPGQPAIDGSTLHLGESDDAAIDRLVDHHRAEGQATAPTGITWAGSSRQGLATLLRQALRDFRGLDASVKPEDGLRRIITAFARCDAWRRYQGRGGRPEDNYLFPERALGRRGGGESAREELARSWQRTMEWEASKARAGNGGPMRVKGFEFLDEEADHAASR